MLCPICKVDLQISERQGIEIDYCPKCRGVWLDRSELDKIIERSAQETRPAEFSDRDREERHHYEERRDDYRGHGDYGKRHHRKKEGFLGNLFEGFGGDD